MTSYSGLVLLGGADVRWVRLAEGGVVGAGIGLPEPVDGEKVAAIYPALETTVFMDIGDGLPRAQAIAVAQRWAAETLLTPIADLHFASGSHVAAVVKGAFGDWLAELKAAGFDPAPVVPAQLVPPAPETGFVRATLGGEDVLRGSDIACAWDAAYGGIITAAQQVAELPEQEIPQQIAKAISQVEVDLRQGAFAQAKPWGGARQFVPACAFLIAAVLIVTLLTPLVLALRLQASAADINRSSEDLARTVVAREELEPQAALERRLIALRGPGKGFGSTASAILTAVKARKDSSVAALTFDDQGVGRVTVLVPSEGDLDSIDEAIRAYGFRVNRGPTAAINGQRRTEFEVRVK